MGGKDLPPLLRLLRSFKERLHTIKKITEDIKANGRCLVAVDLSILMHRGVSSLAGACELHTQCLAWRVAPSSSTCARSCRRYAITEQRP